MNSRIAVAALAFALCAAQVRADEAITPQESLRRLKAAKPGAPQPAGVKDVVEKAPAAKDAEALTPPAKPNPEPLDLPAKPSRAVVPAAQPPAVEASAIGGAPSAAPAKDPGAEIQSLLSEGANYEKQDQCELAYAKYAAAQDLTPRVQDKARAAELESIAIAKLDKLEECYRACQPTGRQRSLAEAAKDAKDKGESKRAAQMLARLLVGKSDKCLFWKNARATLATLPGADALAQDKIDPCEVTPEVQKELEGARASTRRQQQDLDALLAESGKLVQRMPDVIELVRGLEETRLKVFELREEFLDCDTVYRPLVEDAATLRETYEKANGAVLAGFQQQLSSLSAKVRAAQIKASESQKLLESRTSEQQRLKKQFEDLSAFNEELYNDLFSLAGSQAVSFSATVEGRRVEKPMEEIRALVNDQAKALEALQGKYPEYFSDGVNIEGLKRRKLVLEKIKGMMEKMARVKGESRPAAARAVAELDATVQMMDRAIANNEPKVAASSVSQQKGLGSGVLWLALGAGLIAIAGVTFLRFKMSK